MQVTNGLLEKAMTESGKDRFLVDGFPRNEENRAAFEADTGEVNSSPARSQVQACERASKHHQWWTRSKRQCRAQVVVHRRLATAKRTGVWSMNCAEYAAPYQRWSQFCVWMEGDSTTARCMTHRSRRLCCTSTVRSR